MNTKEIELPFENAPDRWEQVTVGMLREMLKNIPDDYEIKIDGACGSVIKGDFAVYHASKEISING